MQKYEEQFLFLLKSYFNDEKLPDGYCFDVKHVFMLASIHNMLPVVFEKACESAEDVSAYKKSCLGLCAKQISKNVAFDALFSSILNANINALVVKGPVCAHCYPNFDMRLSSDFDIIVTDADRAKLHEFLLAEGFVENDSSYFSKRNSLYLEVSTELGEGTEKLKTRANDVFSDFFNRAVKFEKYITLEPTEHLTYLIYHAYKHFIGSGFGIKQIIDIYLFCRTFYNDIDFEKIIFNFEKLKISNFAYNIFYLIKNIFGYDVPYILKNADEKYICCDDFLKDLLESGVFGKSSEDRLHSASLVLNTVENSGDKKLLKAVFPHFSVMKRKHKILKYMPLLLPLLWLYRLFEYLFRFVFGKRNISPFRSIEIADERINLLKKMGII